MNTERAYYNLVTQFEFQSLSRDSGRLNVTGARTARDKSRKFQSLSRDSGRLNPGRRRNSLAETRFQSLSRDSGRLNAANGPDLGQIPQVSIPQSGFGAFERVEDDHRGDDRRGVSIPQSGFGAFEPGPEQ